MVASEREGLCVTCLEPGQLRQTTHAAQLKAQQAATASAETVVAELRASSDAATQSVTRHKRTLPLKLHGDV